jgi:hypothetical protein
MALAKFPVVLLGPGKVGRAVLDRLSSAQLLFQTRYKLGFDVKAVRTPVFLSAPLTSRFATARAAWSHPTARRTSMCRTCWAGGIQVCLSLLIGLLSQNNACKSSKKEN